MMSRSITTSSTARCSPQLKLFVKGETIVELTGRVFARFRHFLHELLRFDNCLEDFALVGFAEHATNKHFKQNQQRFVQRKDQVEFAN